MTRRPARINPSDKRSFIIALTRRGKPAAARVHASLRTLETAVRARVNERDLAGFLAVVGALAAAASD